MLAAPASRSERASRLAVPANTASSMIPSFA